MSDLPENNSGGFIEWLLGGFATLTATFLTWINNKINRLDDKKLSKDVFRQFEKHNDEQHKVTHDALQDIKENDKQAHENLLDKIDGKQDKKRSR